MSTPSVSLGYVVLYVKNVSATLSFYEEAFGLARRFYNNDKGKEYGELETGAARLAFYSLERGQKGSGRVLSFRSLLSVIYLMRSQGVARSLRIRLPRRALSNN